MTDEVDLSQLTADNLQVLNRISAVDHHGRSMPALVAPDQPGTLSTKCLRAGAVSRARRHGACLCQAEGD